MRQTRRQKAVELQQLIKQGPSLSLDTFPPTSGTPRLSKEANEAVQASVRLWLDTWVRPLVRDLVPEYPDQVR